VRARIVSGHLTQNGQFCAKLVLFVLAVNGLPSRRSIFTASQLENSSLRHWEKIGYFIEIANFLPVPQAPYNQHE
jgi:hypothetical protein